MKTMPRLALQALLITIILAVNYNYPLVADYIAYGCLGYVIVVFSDYASEKWLD